MIAVASDGQPERTSLPLRNPGARLFIAVLWTLTTGPDIVIARFDHHSAITENARMPPDAVPLGRLWDALVLLPLFDESPNSPFEPSQLDPAPRFEDAPIEARAIADAIRVWGETQSGGLYAVIAYTGHLLSRATISLALLGSDARSEALEWLVSRLPPQAFSIDDDDREVGHDLTTDDDEVQFNRLVAAADRFDEPLPVLLGRYAETHPSYFAWAI